MKRYHLQLPDMTGKFGFSLNIGKRELFIGIAVAKIEVESITRRKKQKSFTPGKVKIVDFT